MNTCLSVLYTLHQANQYGKLSLILYHVNHNTEREKWKLKIFMGQSLLEYYSDKSQMSKANSNEENDAQIYANTVKACHSVIDFGANKMYVQV